MKTKFAVLLLTLLMAAVYSAATRRGVPAGPADLRDALRDNAALEQLGEDTGDLSFPAVPVAADASAAQEPRAAVPADSGAGGGTRLEQVIRKVRPAVVQVLVPGQRGSGFIILPSGIVATNAHVVASVAVGGAVDIVMADDEIQKGRLLAKGEVGKMDMAFVQIQPGKKALSTLPLNPSAQVSMGTEVLVMGHPRGLPFTVNRGIVSGIEDRKDEYISFLQTDASINPGNSGGPLVTLDGTLVGMNTKIISASGGSEGLGMAIVVKDLVRGWKQYLKLKNLDAPWLGVMLDPKLAVQQLFSGSPAKKAGIGLADVIVGVGKTPVRSVTDFLRQLHAYMPGDTVNITILRDGAFKEVPVVLEAEKNVPLQRVAVNEFADQLPV